MPVRDDRGTMSTGESRGSGSSFYVDEIQPKATELSPRT
jgi:hypothetical protein